MNMISPETQTLLRVATEALRKDIVNVMKAHSRDGGVPCLQGVRRFSRLVETYHVLCVDLDSIGVYGGGPIEATAPLEECAMAMGISGE